jgi:hypothetical protein
MTTGITEMLTWVFPTERTDPVLHLAYWHVRLLSELLSPDLPYRPNLILHATRNITNLLAAKHDLLSPITHHFTTLAALGLLELHRFDETRDEAARLTREVLDYSISPSPWNAAVRDKLTAYQARAGAGAAGLNASQNLQQLADLATAVDGSAATAAPDAGDGGGQSGEETLGAGGSNGAVQQADGGSALSKPGETNGNGDIPQPQQQQQALVDVRALLREGYLAWFDEPPREHGMVD